ncbi:NgoPII family restriction endonuclease [Spirabiliibacterium falconis]|uniref:NgoPII family restriction endonuclease n=1 Tax=Spirabiliibacterium falconis TaxID=572023 RepID=UPI001AAD11F5|nr:NgoPII family restriction endonuclease [Spirabiliibacterium falconis]MBE2893873.1 NgoPII family restriction endonuclease [Spirabiliibacterium falconis]
MNILNAILSLIASPNFELMNSTNSHNRANNMGEALEEYIKDLFADTVEENDSSIRLKKLSEIFSYLGNQNNPPDAMLKDGDAIEIKKIERINSPIALNSSYPKKKLFIDNSMISNACREAEDWAVKDMLYVIGCVDNNQLRALCFVYGDEYCADKEIYKRISSVIKNGVEQIPGVEFAKTNELGRINRVDPLGITYLRVRGMWGIENPFRVFSYIYKPQNKKFNFMALISDEKFSTFKNRQDFLEKIRNETAVIIENVEIKDPDNPVKLKKAKLITFSR